MKINITHNDNIKTFDDISPHIELENEHLEETKALGQHYMAKSNMCKTLGFKCKMWNKNFNKGKGNIFAFNKKPDF
jgi:hypothetical protein